MLEESMPKRTDKSAFSRGILATGSQQHAPCALKSARVRPFGVERGMLTLRQQKTGPKK